jgi:hypothetical protein
VNEAATAAVDRRFRALVFGGAVGLYLLLALVIRRAVIDGIGATFAYSLDDPYIHLALAENLVDHGTWGLVPGVYESASSSPLWTLLLAAAVLIVPFSSVWLPLGLNLLAGSALLWEFTGFRSLVDRQRPVRSAVAGVLLVLGLGVLHLSFLGMEHVLHAALAVAAIRALAAMAEGRPRGALWVGVAFGFATAARFETGFLAVGAVVGILATTDLGDLRRRLRLAAAPVLGAAVPTAVVATVNLAFGQDALPNSVTAKSTLNDGLWGSLEPLHTMDTLHRLARLVTEQPVYALAVAVAGATLCLAWARPAVRVTGLAVLTAAFLQGVYGLVGQANRYEAWLLLSSLAVAALAADGAPGPAPDRAARAVLAALGVLAVGFVLRASDTPTAAGEVFRQPGSVGAFLATAYDGEPVAVSDLGFVAWEHDGPLLDLLGLGSHDVITALEDHTLEPEPMERLVDDFGAHVVAISEFFFPDTPESWTLVRKWCLAAPPRTVVPGCVSFYAPTPADVPVLTERLEAYEDRLPGGIFVVVDP